MTVWLVLDETFSLWFVVDGFMVDSLQLMMIATLN